MKIKKFLRVLCLTFLLCLMFSCTVFADFGPKPELNILVENPPEGTYYLDLLVPYDSPYQNLINENAYDAEKLSLLKNYNDGGWRAALSYGTDIPLFGKLIGEPKTNGTLHCFSYMGLPDNFKIIIVSPDNQLYVSPEIHRNTFKTDMTFDYATHKISQRPLILSYLLQFAMTFGATVIIEGLILLLFGFSLKRNLKPFLTVNLITQLILTATCGTVLLKDGLLSAFISIFPLEVFILIGEAIAYSKLLKPADSKLKIPYAIVANLVSFIASLAMMFIQSGIIE